MSGHFGYQASFIVIFFLFILILSVECYTIDSQEMYKLSNNYQSLRIIVVSFLSYFNENL